MTDLVQGLNTYPAKDNSRDNVNERRAAQLEIIVEISQAVATERDPAALLKRVTNEVRERFNLYHAQIYVFDAGAAALRVEAGAGEVGDRMKATGHSIPISREHSVVVQAAITGAPVVTNDVAAAENFLPNPLLPETRAEMSIPIIAAGQLLGVLDVQAREVNRFDALDISIKQALANQIAVALDNAIAYSEVNAARQSAQTLAALTQAIGLARDEAEVIQGLAGVLPQQNVNISLSVFENYNFERATFVRTLASTQPLDPSLADLPIGMLPVLNALSPDSIGVIPDIATDPLLDEQSRGYMLAQSLNSAIYAPLVVDGRWFGLMTLISPHRHAFSQADAGVFSQVGQLVADKVERLHLDRMLEDQRRKLQTVAEISTTVAGILDLDEMLELFVEETKTGFDLYHAQVYLLDDAEKKLVLAAGSGTAGAFMKSHGHALDLTSTQSVIVQAALSKDGVIISDLTSDPSYLPNPMLPYARSEHALPILLGDRLIGVLDVQSDERGRFGESDILVKKTLARQLATAIQNANEYAHSQRQAEFERALSSISALIRSTASSDQLLDGALKLILNVFGADSGVVSRYNYETDHWNGLVGTGGGITNEMARNFIDPATTYPHGLESLREKRVVAVTSAKDYPDFPFYYIDTLGIKSVMVLPLEVDGRVYGVLFLNFVSQQHVFQQNEIDMAENMAVQVSIGLQQRAKDQEVRTYSEVVASMPIGVYVCRMEDANDPFSFRIVAANPAAERFMGRPNEDVVNRLLVEAFPPLKDTPLPGIHAQVAHSGVGVTIGEVPYEDAQSGAGTYLVSSIPLPNLSVAISFENITERKQAQSALEKQARELQTVADVSRAVTQVLDPDELLESVVNLTKERFNLYHAHIYFLNEDGTDLVLAAGAGLPGQKMKEAGHHIPYSREHSLVARAARTREVVIANDVSTAPDFLPNPLLPETRAEMAVPMTIGDRLIGVLDVQSETVGRFNENDARIKSTLGAQIAVAIENSRSVTHALETERASAAVLEKQARELQTVADVSHAVTQVLDPDELLKSVVELTKERFNLYHAHIYFLNDEGTDLVLAAGAGVAGKSMREAGHRIPYSREHSLVALAARTREVVIANDVSTAPDFLPNPLLPETRAEMAVPITIGDRLIGVLDVQSETIGRFNENDARIKSTLAAQIGVAIENARSVTFALETERATADRLREVDRLKSQFLASMSHELRTPLNSIIGYSEVILDGDDGELTPDAAEDVEIIHQSGKHLLAIINDILDLAKIEAGQMRMDATEVDLKSIALDTVNTASILIKERDLELKLIEQDKLPPLLGDPIRIRQILTNLVGNAVKFTEKGSVTVTVGRIDVATAFVSVRDTGIGIDNAHLELIFDQFRQVDDTSTRRAGGTGLGLAITRRLAEMLGGSITVQSEVGKGSEFFVTLPIRPAHLAQN
ncbi:MAG: GAF domain-containing protein [Pleurocapsa minor GSE-CHR-MK-17-07R]|nr:GAF domain-containing protein [Pleurocapsa minor GSE-CHR-MK 17-07R]